MNRIVRFTGRMAPIPNENVDTDQITPARFLKTSEKSGLGKVLFYDWRYDSDGNPRSEFALNRPEFAGASILLAGHNFGCGSSREHAPWALADFGFRAIISTSFADIFRNNCLKNGILPIVVDREFHRRLFEIAARRPADEILVDLETRTITVPGGESGEFPIDPFSRRCLLEGVDELGYLLLLSDRIEAYEKSER